MNHPQKSLTDVAKVTAVVLAGISLVVATAATIVIAKDLILLIFLGVLFGVFLTHCAGLLKDNTPLNRGWSLATVTILLVAVIGGGTASLGLTIEQRFDGMSKRLDEASEKLEIWLGEHPLAMQIVKKVPYANEILTQQSFLLTDGSETSATDKQQPSDDRGATNDDLGSESRDGSGENADAENSESEKQSDSDRSDDSGGQSRHGRFRDRLTSYVSNQNSCRQDIHGVSEDVFHDVGAGGELGTYFLRRIILGSRSSTVPRRFRETISNSSPRTDCERDGRNGQIDVCMA